MSLSDRIVLVATGAWLIAAAWFDWKPYNAHMNSRLHWHHCSGLGGLAWLLMLALLPATTPTTSLMTGLLLLAVLVFVPLALGLVEPGAVTAQVAGLRRLMWLQPFAAAAAVAAFLLPAGALAGTLALGWLLFAGIVALLGLVRCSALAYMMRPSYVSI
jgi:hypothetical protein